MNAHLVNRLQEPTPPAYPPAYSRQRAKQFVQDLQDEICQALQQLDGKARFQEDKWERAEGGGGRTRVIRDGRVFEQGGVNFSEVWGDSLPASILNQRPEAAGHDFYATGTSMVLHPAIPTFPPYISTTAILKQDRFGGLAAA